MSTMKIPQWKAEVRRQNKERNVALREGREPEAVSLDASANYNKRVMGRLLRQRRDPTFDDTGE